MCGCDWPASGRSHEAAKLMSRCADFISFARILASTLALPLTLSESTSTRRPSSSQASCTTRTHRDPVSFFSVLSFLFTSYLPTAPDCGLLRCVSSAFRRNAAQHSQGVPSPLNRLHHRSPGTNGFVSYAGLSRGCRRHKARRR